MNAFKYSILASGSTGNSTYIETDKHKILVDAGLTAKKIEEALSSINRKASDIDSLLITHEHSDHIKGIGVLARKYRINLYANELTWKKILDNEMIGKVDPELIKVFSTGKILTFDDIDIESFAVSHDAVAPQFYRFMKDNKSFAILTDTGYLSDRMAGIIKNADAYIMESNYDVEMLRYGPYPWRTKQRILSDEGHLSNEDGATAALTLLGDNTQRIFLGHRSQHNNTLEQAHHIMKTRLEQQDIDTNKLQILDTSHLEASPLYKI
ncbi:MAG: MBL fold metallo-hydrolase [Lactovum sp.]